MHSTPGRADPKELASLLGLLVFCSAAVPHGRIFMQGMLRQFAHLDIDWTRGVVRFLGQERWGKVELTDAFWRDLSWWQSALRERPGHLCFVDKTTAVCS